MESDLAESVDIINKLDKIMIDVTYASNLIWDKVTQISLLFIRLYLLRDRRVFIEIFYNYDLKTFV